MNKPMATLGAAAAGALAMYYLDPELGARRRALLADLVRGVPGERRTSAGRGRYQRRAYLRATQSDPRNDGGTEFGSGHGVASWSGGFRPR